MKEVFDKWGDHLGTIHLSGSELLPFRAVGYYNNYVAEDVGWFATEAEAEARVKGWHRES